MRIGVRAHDYGKLEIEQLAQTLHSRGYQCAQLTLPKAMAGINSINDITYRHLERVRTSFEHYQIDIAVFGCYVDLSNPDEETRRNAVNALKKCLAFGKEVGAKCVGTETAYGGQNAEQKKYRFPFMLDAIKEVVEEAARLDMKLGLEPVDYYPLDGIEAAQRVFDTIQDPQHMGLIFDPCNVLGMSIVDTQEKHWAAWMDAVGKYIDSVHVKDVVFNENGNRIQTPLGKGVARYEEISRWLHANKPDMYMIRDEMNIAMDTEDIAFMKKL